MDHRSKNRKKLRLYSEQGGKCYWCEQPMTLALHHVKKRGPLEATFDHLDDRFSPERGTYRGVRRIVLACNQCNFERGRESMLAQGIEELRRRAGRFPSIQHSKEG